MDTFATISILNTQIKNINIEIRNFVQNVVCPTISTQDKVKWTCFNVSKNSLWITAINPNMSQESGGTIGIIFKDGNWFFKNTLENAFIGVDSNLDNAEQMYNFYHAMSIFIHFGKNNQMMKELNELFEKKEALYLAIQALLK